MSGIPALPMKRRNSPRTRLTVPFIWVVPEIVDEIAIAPLSPFVWRGERVKFQVSTSSTMTGFLTGFTTVPDPVFGTAASAARPTTAIGTVIVVRMREVVGAVPPGAGAGGACAPAGAAIARKAQRTRPDRPTATASFTPTSSPARGCRGSADPHSSMK